MRKVLSKRLSRPVSRVRVEGKKVGGWSLGVEGGEGVGAWVVAVGVGEGGRKERGGGSVGCQSISEEVSSGSWEGEVGGRVGDGGCWVVRDRAEMGNEAVLRLERRRRRGAVGVSWSKGRGGWERRDLGDSRQVALGVEEMRMVWKVRIMAWGEERVSVGSLGRRVRRDIWEWGLR